MSEIIDIFVINPDFLRVKPLQFDNFFWILGGIRFAHSVAILYFQVLGVEEIRLNLDSTSLSSVRIRINTAIFLRAFPIFTISPYF